MDRRRRFTEEFRIEAVKQITERGFAVKDVSQRLGVSPYSLYEWVKRYGVPTEDRLAKEDQAARIKKLGFIRLSCGSYANVGVELCFPLPPGEGPR